MLLGLSIRDVVLIRQLDLTFKPGLCVLTGETGAGKSILLDALGLALGNRASPDLIRRGAAQATVAAEFAAPSGHESHAILREQGLDGDDRILMRRIVGSDGRSRGFINDQPVSITLMKAVGDTLVEIQGQSEQRGLLDAATHRDMLDAYGGLQALRAGTADAWRTWRDAEAALAEGRASLTKAEAEEDFLRHTLAELEALHPEPGEDARLAEAREILMNQEKLVEALNLAREALAQPDPVEDSLRTALGHLERAAAKAGGRLDPVIEALGRAAIELQEAVTQLDAAGADIDLDGGKLAEIEDRFFALKDVARKHRVEVDALPALREKVAAELAALEDQSGAIRRLEQAVAAARAAYVEAAGALSEARSDAAARLDEAMAAELPPLRLEKARFVTRIEPLAEKDWGRHGMNRVAFEAATNPGANPGPIGRIASGGELSRFMLALKVVLSRISTVPTIVFDEVDSGIGGATAYAVGERLARLGTELQVLVVTHSPQVAARGGHHWRVVKSEADADVVTSLDELTGRHRKEEIARMLSGRRVTDEARAAADSLLAGERI